MDGYLLAQNTLPVMEDYLLAQCVIDSLTRSGIIEPSAWENLDTQTLCYDVSFSHTTKNSRMCFQIKVFNEMHLLSKTSLINTSKRYGFNFADIVEECSIP